MRRILLIMMALVLIIGLAPASIVGAQENDTDRIYGITSTGDIYEIDPLNGTETLVATVDECPVGGSGPNGLAYDQSTNRIYYTEYPDTNDQGLTGTPDGKTSLYFIDLGTGTETFAGLLEGEVACADIYQGHYYYIAGGANLGYTDDLYKVQLLGDGTIGTIEVYEGVSGDRNSQWGFWGDIAIQDGVIYGTGYCFARQTQEFFQVDTDGGNFQFIRDATAALQLAFGLDGQLYGHIFTDGRTWKVDWTSGATPPQVTFLFTATYRYTDLASGKTSTIEPELYDICGFKYADWEDQLIPLPDWSIQLYAWNATSGDWASTATTTTDENGKYCFTDLLAGTYRVSETLKDGWDQIYPDPEGLEGGAHTFALPGGQTYGGAAIYGIGTTTAVGSATNDGNIYLIDPVANTQEIIFEDVWAEAGVGVGPWWYPNALAFDEENGRLYFSLSPNSLYFYDVDTAAVVDADPDNKFSNAENVLGATFAGGSYWYVLNQSDKLIEVTVDSDGFVTAVSDPITMGSPVVLSQGDIVYDDGVIYGSSGTGAGGGSNFKGFFSFDTSTDVFTVLYQDPDYRALQLAWGMLDADGNKVLYGHQVENGTWYTIDLDPYAVNQVMDGDDPFLTDRLEDIASAIQPKYYNFINTPELICEGETAWAAEAHPGEQRFSNANNWATYVGYTRGDGTEDEPKAYPLYAGQHYLAGMLYVYNEGATLYVRYTIDIPEGILEHCLENGGKIYQAEGLCAGDWTGFLEYHLHVAEDEDGIPRTRTGRKRVLSNPIPGHFEYDGYFDPAEDETGWVLVDISGLDDDFVIAAHAVMQWCGYDCDALEEIEENLQP